MKTRLIATLTALLLALTLGAPTATAAAETRQGQADPAPTTVGPSGRAVYIKNSLYSTHSIRMCTGHNGSGTCYVVPRNSTSPVKVRSVYARPACLTMVNSRSVWPGTYWNTGRLSWGPHAAVTIC